MSEKFNAGSNWLCRNCRKTEEQSKLKYWLENFNHALIIQFKFCFCLYYLSVKENTGLIYIPLLIKTYFNTKISSKTWILCIYLWDFNDITIRWQWPELQPLSQGNLTNFLMTLPCKLHLCLSLGLVLFLPITTFHLLLSTCLSWLSIPSLSLYISFFVLLSPFPTFCSIPWSSCLYFIHLSLSMPFCACVPYLLVAPPSKVESH